MSKLFSWFKKEKASNEGNNNKTSENDTLDTENNKGELNTSVDETPDDAASENITQVDEGTVKSSVDEEVQDKQEDSQDSVSSSSAEIDLDEITAKSLDSDDTVTKVLTATEAEFKDESRAVDEQVQEQTSNQEPLNLQDNVDIESVTESDEESKQKKDKKGLFARLRDSLSRTKANIGSGFSKIFAGQTIDDELYEDLETQLLLADVGMNTTKVIIDQLTKSAGRAQLKDANALSDLLQKQMQEILDGVNKPLDLTAPSDSEGNKQPFVILMVGVNGVGKTTTIGKLAKQYQAQGKSVMLAAGDTFRAAAVEQLQVWGERNDIPVVAQQTGADSASVIFDAIASAKAKKADILIADTAGRLQNKDNLIEELKKVVRVMKKLDPHAPHEIMLTLDASTGQNAVSQTKIFNEAVGITGINLTKLDGSAKGGVIFALANEFKIPVRYIGIGEGIDDLRPFESKAFVDALFAEDN